MKTLFLLTFVAFFASTLHSQPLTDKSAEPFGYGWEQYPYISSSVNDHVNAVAVSGSDVYVGGNFTQAGTNPANYITRWDGNEWHSLGDGLNGNVHSIVIEGTDVYVGGEFTMAGGSSANRIARWDGAQWHPLGTGLNNTVRAIYASPEGIYAGGLFSDSNGQPGNGVSLWDGSSWNALGNGTHSVFALTKFENDLYIGGAFTYVGDGPANRIAKWDGDTWSEVAGGFDDEVYTLMTHDGELYVGGRFSRVNDELSFKVARWDGENWHRYLQSIGTIDAVSAFAFWDDQLFIGGNIFSAGGVFVNNFARWSDDGWVAVGNGMNRRISAMAVGAEGIFAGGWFTRGSHYVARFDGSDWVGMNSGQAAGLSGYQGYTAAVVNIGTDLYVGGRLTGAGNLMANHIAMWDGTQWHALAEGMNGEVSALIEFNGELYAGGTFTITDGVDTRGIARWDGSQWHALGANNPSSVYALAEWNGDLYAAGGFRNFGGNVYNKIARWDGSEWHDLNGGVDPGQFEFGQVYSLLASADRLYVGGSFTIAGGQPASRLASWNGSEWAEVTSELDNTVFALAEWQGNLFMAGEFTSPGNRVAGLVDGEWNDLNGGFNERAYAFYPNDELLYVGGQFSNAGGVTLRGVATWDGEEWEGVGAGINGSVRGFEMYEGRLFVAGSYVVAGDLPTSFLASWGTTESGNVELLLPANEEVDVPLNATLSWNAVPGVDSYSLDLATDAAFDNIVSPVRGITTTSVSYTNEPLDPDTQYWWRVRTVTGSTEGAWSAAWSFTTGTVTSIPVYTELPDRLILNQNYPNPFNPVTIIQFGLAVQDEVRLEVYTLTGQLVARLANEQRNAGWHQLNFDASRLASGVYFYRLQTSTEVISRKLTVIK